MDEPTLKDVISTLVRATRNKPISWRLEGSANLVVQGLKTAVNELNIATNHDGIEIFQECLLEYIPQLRYDEEKQAHILSCTIHNQQIEILAYHNADLQMLGRLRLTVWQGLLLPILPLELAKIFYEAINKPEKVQLIQQFLNEHLFI